MNTVKINKAQLLAKVTANRAQHRELYEEAKVNHRKKVIVEVSKILAAAKAGKKFAHSLSLPPPTNHTASYDRAIAMLKMSVEIEVTITEENFSELVLDNWSWQRGWVASNLSYSSKIAKMRLAE